LGQPYVKVRDSKDEIYYKVRCGPAHSYLIEENSIIDMKPGLPCGIEYNSNNILYISYPYLLRTLQKCS